MADNIIDKKKFIELMTRYKEIIDIEYYLHDGFQKLDKDFGGFSLGKTTELSHELLKLLMNDTCDWISYYIYDCDWGTKDRKVTVKGKNIKLKTFSNLYDLITKY